MEDTMTALSRELEEQEQIILECMEDFVRLGMAMKAIRDGRLYKAAGHSRFEDYCKEKWDLSKRHVDQTISSADLRTVLPVSKKMGTSGSQKWTERAVRPLKRLESTSRAKHVAKRVLVEVEKGAKLTSGLVSKHVDAELGIDRRNPPPKPKPKFEDVILRWTDELESMAHKIKTVPDDALALFAKNHKAKARALAAAIETLENSLTRVWESLP